MNLPSKKSELQKMLGTHAILKKYHSLTCQKVLAHEATDGKVWVSYNDPNYLKQRFSLSDELVKNIAIIAPLIYQALSPAERQ